MLGCRDYVELAMYRPRVGTSLQSSKQPNTIKTSGAGHHPWTPADEYSNDQRRRSMNQLNDAAPGRAYAIRYHLYSECVPKCSSTQNVLF